MSRSTRKPIIKDKPRNGPNRTARYWRKVRSAIKTAMRSQREELPDPKTIVNQWDYCDYTIRLNKEDDDLWNVAKHTRK